MTQPLRSDEPEPMYALLLWDGPDLDAVVEVGTKNEMSAQAASFISSSEDYSMSVELVQRSVAKHSASPAQERPS